MKKKKQLYALISFVLAAVLALALAGCGRTTGAQDGEQPQQALADQPEIAASEQEAGPAMNADGKYVYVVAGKELPLSVRLEDYIDGNVLDLKSLRNALGYTEGKIRDGDGNVIAETGTPDKQTPLAGLSFYMNLADKEQTIIYYVTAMPDTDSQALTMDSFNPPRSITFDQLVVAAYLWEYYNDGQIHDDPLAEILSDCRYEHNNRQIVYQVP